MTKSEQQAEAVMRARTGQSFSNYPAIVQGFMDKGIAPEDITPRVNVFTFHAWQALGRVVKKGEHGVKIVTWIDCNGKETDEAGTEKETSYRRPRTTTVFHVSQTEPITEQAAAKPESKPKTPWGKSTYQRRESSSQGDKTDRWNERQF